MGTLKENKKMFMTEMNMYSNGYSKLEKSTRTGEFTIKIYFD